MRSGQRGFTLLELLVGITLMALLLSALLIGLHIGIRAWQQGEARLSEAQQEAERTGFLDRQVASLVPYEVMSPDPEQPAKLTVLDATPARLRFLSSYGSRSRAHSGLLLIEYGLLEAEAGKTTLALRESPVGSDRALVQGIVRQVSRDPETGQLTVSYQPFDQNKEFFSLRTELEEAKFDYLDPKPEPGAPAWVANWTPTSQKPYPAAVRLRWREEGRAVEQVVLVRARVFAQ